VPKPDADPIPLTIHHRHRADHTHTVLMNSTWHTVSILQCGMSGLWFANILTGRDKAPGNRIRCRRSEGCTPLEALQYARADVGRPSDEVCDHFRCPSTHCLTPDNEDWP
jgi:hypothetical protein